MVSPETIEEEKRVLVIFANDARANGEALIKRLKRSFPNRVEVVTSPGLEQQAQSFIGEQELGVANMLVGWFTVAYIVYSPGLNKRCYSTLRALVWVALIRIIDLGLPCYVIVDQRDVEFNEVFGGLFSTKRIVHKKLSDF